MPTQTRKLIVQQLTCLFKETDRRLLRGYIKTIALQHNTPRWTIERLWESAKTTMQNCIGVDVNNRKRERINNIDDDD